MKIELKEESYRAKAERFQCEASIVLGSMMLSQYRVTTHNTQVLLEFHYTGMID